LILPFFKLLLFLSFEAFKKAVESRGCKVVNIIIIIVNNDQYSTDKKYMYNKNKMNKINKRKKCETYLKLT